MATCKQECRCSSFGLGGARPELFATPQANWYGMPFTFITYRLAVAAYQVIFFILVLIYWGEEPFYRPVDSKGKWFIFVSNWTFTTVTIYFVLAAITTIYWQVTNIRKVSGASDRVHSSNDIEMNPNPTMGSTVPLNEDDDDQPSTPWYFQVTWFFRVFASAATIFITIFFWVLEYDPASSSIHVFSLNVHLVAMILMIFDMLLVAAPYRILHMIYVMIVSFLYFVFTAIYHAAGGRNPQGETFIYSGNLDWGNAPGRTAIVGAITVFVASPIFHLIFYALYRLRLAFGLCCACCKTQS